MLFVLMLLEMLIKHIKSIVLMLFEYAQASDTTFLWLCLEESFLVLFMNELVAKMWRL